MGIEKELKALYKWVISELHDAQKKGRKAIMPWSKAAYNARAKAFDEMESKVSRSLWYINIGSDTDMMDRLESLELANKRLNTEIVELLDRVKLRQNTK